jgi:hypothetical protein
MASLRKNNILSSFLNQFSQFPKIKSLKLIRLLAIILSPFGLTYFNSMFSLFFLLLHTSSYLITFKRMKIKIFLAFIFFLVDFQLNFLKASNLYSG